MVCRQLCDMSLSEPMLIGVIDFCSEFLTHCGLGYFNEILNEYFSNQLQWLMAEIPALKLALEECH